jgi:hypothetical protein
VVKLVVCRVVSQSEIEGYADDESNRLVGHGTDSAGGSDPELCHEEKVTMKTTSRTIHTRIMNVLTPALGVLALSCSVASWCSEVGSTECGEAQRRVQEEIGDESDYKSHGQYVKAVRHLTNQMKKSGEISGKCASCIGDQFTKRTPVAEQSSCGSDGAARFPEPPAVLPDLVVSAIEITNISELADGRSRIAYRFTITNIGAGDAVLTPADATSASMVRFQAYVSTDAAYSNDGDAPAGGAVFSTSPLVLADGRSLTRSFSGAVSTVLDYLILKVDAGDVLEESDEDNNTMAVPIPR